MAENYIIMKKLSNDEVSLIFKKYNCELISEYVNVYTSLKYRCACGHISNTNLRCFKKSHKCKICAAKNTAAKRRITYDVVKNYFTENNCLLLTLNYENCFQILDYKCSCGNLSKISFSSFKKGHRCKKCSLRFGERNNRWNPNREAVRLSEIIRKKCYNLLARSLLATNKKKETKTIELLGYTPSILREWIISHPKWENIKNNKWHLDHIFPIKAFIDYGITDLKIINCIDNLQPIFYKDNLKNQGNYSKIEFESWLTKKEVPYDKN